MNGRKQKQGKRAQERGERQESASARIDKNLHRAAMDIEKINKTLETNAKVLTELKERRREIKNQLNKEGIREEDELKFAEQLETVTRAIKRLEDQREKLYRVLATGKL